MRQSRVLAKVGLTIVAFGAMLAPSFLFSAPPVGVSSILSGTSSTTIFFNPIPLNAYGGFYSPGSYLPLPPPAGSYLPSSWWAGPNAGDDPRQAGYNPSGGYSWDSVAAILISTNPPRARVTLDGTYIGTANYLGPIQLPMGEHTLKIEAPGYEPSETVLRVEQPTVQQLDVRLDPVKEAARVTPRAY